MDTRSLVRAVLNEVAPDGYIAGAEFSDMMNMLAPSLDVNPLIAQMDPWRVGRLSCKQILNFFFPRKWEYAFFDLDDCLYRNEWVTEKKIATKMDAYLMGTLKLPEGSSDRLYKTYGTTIAGLIEEGHLAERDVQSFLDAGHDIELSGDIKPDPELRRLLGNIPCRRWVFSNSAKGHVERCLKILGIHDMFEGIVAASSVEMFSRCGYVTKPHPRCFQAAMDLAGVKDPRSCIFFDDNPKNVAAAKQVGWAGILVGLTGRKGERVQCPEADDRIAQIHDMPMAVPEWFGPREWEYAFFDLDDCLYRNEWVTEKKIATKMDAYLMGTLKLPEGSSDRLYKTYGTTIAGLIEEGHLAERDVQSFLDAGHDIELSGDIKPDPELRRLLGNIPCRRWVFSNSAKGHVERCLKILGIHDMFEGIVAASSVEMFSRCGYVTKPHPRCFQAAMDLAGVKDPRSCIFFDDNPKNVAAAKQVGWTGILVGLTGRKGERVQCPEADNCIAQIHNMPMAVPQWFTLN